MIIYREKQYNDFTRCNHFSGLQRVNKILALFLIKFYGFKIYDNLEAFKK